MEQWLFKVIEGIQTGTIGLAGLSVCVNIYLYMQNQRLQRQFADYLRSELEKNDRREAVNAEIISVLSALNSKVRRPPPA